MAISKERLKELIEQRALIFYILNNSVALLRLNNSYGISVEEYNKEHNCKPQFYHSGYVYQDICDADKIFETEEDAQEYLEFDTTQKTEILLMCDWSVAKDKKCGYCADFWVDGSNYSMLISGDTIYIQEEYYSNEKWNKDILFKESLNRENYDRARRLCNKLFLGDSDE